MANIVKLKRSAVASAVPTTAQLDLGELAINTFDGKLFLKRNNGTEAIVEIGAGGGGGGGNTFLTISSDSGSTTANSTSDTLTVIGSGGITTSITGDTLTINGSGSGGGVSLGLNLAIASGLIFF
jgi:hypothetical protein